MERDRLAARIPPNIGALFIFSAKLVRHVCDSIVISLTSANENQPI
jgi:hypothetical protein